MEKTVKVGNNEVKLIANAAIPIVYRELFASDILTDITPVIEGKTQMIDYKVGAQLLYTMAKEAAEHDGAEFPESLKKFLAGFDSTMDIYNVFPDVITLWISNSTTIVDAKKKKTLQSAK